MTGTIKSGSFYRKIQIHGGNECYFTSLTLIALLLLHSPSFIGHFPIKLNIILVLFSLNMKTTVTH